MPDWLSAFVQAYGPLITPGAILISASVAVWAIFYNQGIARRRATVDLIMDEKRNQEFLRARKVVRDLHEANAQFAKFALLENVGSPENEAILTVLNAREFVAVGIREGAFDEETVKRLQYSVFIRDWNALQTYIMEFRKSRGYPTLFQDFEWLAKKWIADPIKAETPKQ